MFADRSDAGRQLGERLTHLRGRDDVVVVGLPRGGVPVAFEVAQAIDAPLDVIVVRKLGVPFQPELAMGAIGEDDVRVLNQRVLDMARVGHADIAKVEAHERIELARRSKRFRGGRERIPLADRTVVVVDDGIATGSTAKAACQVARAEGATAVVLAVPVAPDDAEVRMSGVADEFIAVATPASFAAVGQFYDDFSQTTDDEVVDLLEQARVLRTPEPDPTDESQRAFRFDDEVVVEADVSVGGHLTVPAGARAVVVFAHGSGSSRFSPRNRFVASVLNEVGIATLLFDLLTRDEEVDRTNVFDIGLLARRLVAVTEWVRERPDLRGLSVGYFGASTGAGAALAAAAEPDARVYAVVSRGGRPDLAGERLGSVHAPTLLIVGGNDRVVLGLNREAASRIAAEHRVEVVPGASHLFEEPGTLEAAAQLARDWFVEHLPTS